MTFRIYLEKKNIVDRSIIRMGKQLSRWLIWLKIPVGQSTYKDLMDYVAYLQNQDKSLHHINRNVRTIGHYYEYKGLPNIALGVRLKGIKTKALARPIKAEDLNQIYQVFEGDELEKIILGLMIYQGLESGDFMTIETNDIDLEKGTIYVPARKKRNSRKLALQAHQILSLIELLQEEKTTEKLFSPYNDKEDHFHYLLQKLSKKLKHQIKEKLEIDIIKLSHLRQSRIAIWVKKEGIRKGQYKAGFKKVTSAERYQKADLENLREQIKKHHPFK